MPHKHVANQKLAAAIVFRLLKPHPGSFFLPAIIIMTMAHVVSSIVPRQLRPLNLANAQSIIGWRNRHFHPSIAAGQSLASRHSYYSAVAFQSPSYAHVHHHSRHSHPSHNHHRQRRSYRFSSTKEPSSDTDKKSIQPEDDIDDETLARHNTLSRRLYRTLLRSCRQGVEIANRGNTFDEYGSTPKTATGSSISSGKNHGKNPWILLQPPMDQRKYGFAKIAEARRGEFSTRKCNKTVRNMSVDDVGMAMEVLRFVHISLGGDAEDDLQDYYLESYDDGEGTAGSDDTDGSDDENDANSNDLEVIGVGAAAGRHSEGHYTQFLDEDEERGEAPEEGKPSSKGNHNVVEVVDDDDGEIHVFEWDSDEEDDDDDLEMDQSVLVTSTDLQNAVRIAFRAPLVSASQSQEETQPLSTIIARRHRDAINACAQLAEQFGMWGNRSSISIDYDRGVRVVVTSSLMMRTTEGASRKNRFSYRIRVENIMDMLEEQKMEEDQSKEAGSEGEDGEQKAMVEHRAVQLLGRTWKISERGPWHKTSTSLLQRLLEEGVIANTEGNDEKADGTSDKENDNLLRVVQTVNEPKTGAVGHMPVLGPGEVFEYMSGADIATPTGAMEGCFHMAFVDMQDTDSAHVGDHVEALTWKANDERRFEMPVARFGLVVDEDVDT